MNDVGISTYYNVFTIVSYHGISSFSHCDELRTKFQLQALTEYERVKRK